HHNRRYTVIALSSFLEAFQKLADLALDSKGGPKDIGSSLTRLCMRHKQMETQLKLCINSLGDSLVLPIQEKMDEWKKNVVALDKEHSKDYKKLYGEVKKSSGESIKLKKKYSK
ncbi:hypothetical protein HELRODRAFT_146067, partial [Helobdella robusta]|uniref:IMD domain-containing protein n=1 Tax=Helobdella robusta TaxID=6412 RepID=T1EJQ0_HELRO